MPGRLASLRAWTTVRMASLRREPAIRMASLRGSTTVGMVPALLGNSKVHLFFKAVHFGNLDLDLISQLDDSSSAASNQVVAARFVDVKIIFHGRERHGTAHPEARHIHKE